MTLIIGRINFIYAEGVAEKENIKKYPIQQKVTPKIPALK